MPSKDIQFRRKPLKKPKTAFLTQLIYKKALAKIKTKNKTTFACKKTKVLKAIKILTKQQQT